jgi:uncharacterized protein (DUF305 family)
MEAKRGWQIATALLAVIAIVAIIFAAVSMTGNHDDDMTSGGAGHDMSQMMGSGDEWDGPMMSMGDMPGMSMEGSGAMAMDQKAFIAMMVAHHQMAVDMAKVEIRRGKDPQVKAMAKQVVADQSKEIAEMKSWYRNWYGEEIPSMPMSGAMGMMGMSMDMDELRTTTEPDRVFLRMMQPHHAGAILMADMVLQGKPRKEVSDLAKQIVAAQSDEMGSMQEMRERIYPPVG